MLADGEIPLLIAEQVRTEENEKLRKDMDLHSDRPIGRKRDDCNQGCRWESCPDTVL